MSPGKYGVSILFSLNSDFLVRMTLTELVAAHAHDSAACACLPMRRQAAHDVDTEHKSVTQVGTVGRPATQCTFSRLNPSLECCRVQEKPVQRSVQVSARRSLGCRTPCVVMRVSRGGGGAGFLLKYSLKVLFIIKSFPIFYGTVRYPVNPVYPGTGTGYRR